MRDADEVQRRRRRIAWGVGAAAAIVGLALAATGLNTLARYHGLVAEPQSPAVLSAFLRPFYRARTPAGEGPFPTALLLSGCDGPKDNLERWSDMMVADGWATIVVDSHGPRKYDSWELWRLICAGQLLQGAERAGDLLVAIDDARAMPFVDPERIVLVGASHGGWTIMDLLALDPPAELPPNLLAAPPTVAERGLSGVVGTILLYPWCGPANRARGAGWRHPAPVLFVLAEGDAIAPPGPCRAIAERLAENGVPVEVLTFEGVTHGFDQMKRAAFSTLEFDPQATADALGSGAAFLAAVAGASPPEGSPPADAADR